MEDVSTELAAFPRVGLSGKLALECCRAVLTRLAGFHVSWENPENQSRLKAYPWLRQVGDFNWVFASQYAAALGKKSLDPIPESSFTSPPRDGVAEDLQAFLAWLPEDARPLWQELLVDRSRLAAGLEPIPRTLLHNDLDDRNIGLRWGSEAEELPDLILIDWEWMSWGPAAIDVAKVVHLLPAVISRGETIPEACWNDELPDYYFEQYRAYGGRELTYETWQRSYRYALANLRISST